MSELVDRARALRTDILAAREEMDAARRLPDDLVRKFIAAQFYRLCIPREHGGLQAEPRILAEVIEALAETDASAAWCATIGATTGAFGAWLDPAAARIILSDADAILSGVYAPTGTAAIEGDAYRVSGRWKWNSGGLNSTWLCGGCVIMEDGAPRLAADGRPEHRMVLFPARDATFHDTWRTSGLRGTGSGDMSVTDILIPRAHSVSLTADRPRVEAPLYAFPVFGLLAVGTASVAGGNALAALSEFRTLAISKRLPGGRTLAERGVVQSLFAETSADLNAARTLFFSAIDDAWREAQSAPQVSLDRRARLRLAATHLARTSADVVRRLQDMAGGAGVFLSDPLQRRLNDAQTITAHIMVAPATYELTGRALLGLPVADAEL